MILLTQHEFSSAGDPIHQEFQKRSISSTEMSSPCRSVNARANRIEDPYTQVLRAWGHRIPHDKSPSG
jgi:hypothetical protein